MGEADQWQGQWRCFAPDDPNLNVAGRELPLGPPWRLPEKVYKYLPC